MRTERLPEIFVETSGLISQFSVLISQFSVLSSQFSVLSSQFSVLSSQFSVLSSQNWMCFLVLWIRDFWFSLRSAIFIGQFEKILSLPLVEQVDGSEDRITYDFEALGT